MTWRQSHWLIVPGGRESRLHGEATSGRGVVPRQHGLHSMGGFGLLCNEKNRQLQRSAAHVLSAIYEQGFLPCSFGGRPGRGTQHGLATLHEVIAGRKVAWVLAGLRNFFGSLSHDWMLRFVEHR